MIELHPELARSIVEGLPAGIAVIDQDGRVVWCNTTLGELLRKDVDSIIGCDANALQLPLPKRDLSRFAPDHMRIVENGGLLGVSRLVSLATFGGRALLVVDRELAIEWFFDALSSGGFDGTVTSRLLSRNALLNRLQLEVSRSRRYANPLSCLMIRIDFGTDETVKLRAVHDVIAGILTEQLRWVDVLGQWSDKALVVVLPETTDSAGQQLAEKIAATLQPTLADSAPAVNINVGASSWRRGDDAERLVRRADIVARRQIGLTARSIGY